MFSNVCDAPGISDHHFTYLAYNIKKDKVKPRIVRARDFKNFDREGFNNVIEHIHWESIVFVGNVNTKVTILENFINQALDKFAPFKIFTVRKPGGTPWITDEIKGKMDEGDKAKDTFNFTGDQKFFDIYRILKNGVNNMMRREQCNLFNAEISDFMPV